MRGRPKLPAGEAKAGMMALRLRPDEQAAIESAAQKVGKSVSDYVRDTLLAKPPIPPSEPTRLQWYGNGKLVYVETPADLSREVWEKLKRYVTEVLKPVE